MLDAMFHARKPEKFSAKPLAFVATRPAGASRFPVLRLDPLAVGTIIVIVVDIALFRFLFGNRVVRGDFHYRILSY